MNKQELILEAIKGFNKDTIEFIFESEQEKSAQKEELCVDYGEYEFNVGDEGLQAWIEEHEINTNGIDIEELGEIAMEAMEVSFKPFYAEKSKSELVLASYEHWDIELDSTLEILYSDVKDTMSYFEEQGEVQDFEIRKVLKQNFGAHYSNGKIFWTVPHEYIIQGAITPKIMQEAINKRQAMAS